MVPSFTVRDSPRRLVVPLLIHVPFQPAASEITAQGGRVLAELSAVTVQATCAPAQSKITTLDAQGDWEIRGTLPNGCNATSYAPNVTIGTWYGWVVPAPFACVHGINPNEPNKTDPGYFYEPVAFSFVKNTSLYSMVFCYSTLVEHNVVATLALGNETSAVSNVTDEGVVASLGFGPNG
jgi:hypothetical protein